VGRHSKLDDAALETIRLAARRGLSERETWELAGVSRRTWRNWKARAERVSQVLPEHWRALRYDELAAVIDELEIDLALVKRTGSGGRKHSREDLVRVLADRAARYGDLLREMERAKPHAKLAILERLDELMRGARITKTRTTQRVVKDPATGAPVAIGETIVTTEEILLPPDRQVLLKVLAARWPEEYGSVGRRGDGDADAPDPAKDRG
jgi:predicted DNA-binding protein (UPF0251 family)